MSKLRLAGEKLGKYELEKRHAIEIEDYDRARYKKNQIEQFRSEVYAELHVEQLMEANGVIIIYIHLKLLFFYNTKPDINYYVPLIIKMFFIFLIKCRLTSLFLIFVSIL